MSNAAACSPAWNAARRAQHRLKDRAAIQKRADEANALKSAHSRDRRRINAGCRAAQRRGAVPRRHAAHPQSPEDDVPVAPDESGNVVVKESGQKPRFDFDPLPHWDLGERLGIIDLERGARLSGSRFYVLKGGAAQLQRALANWFLDVHVEEHGFQEVYPPFMVREECMVGTGNLPKFGDVLYRDAEEDYWFIPTAEVPVTNLHRDEIIEAGALPLYYVAHTPCFRAEGVRGQGRARHQSVHQFEKVEMVKFVEPRHGATSRSLRAARCWSSGRLALAPRRHRHRRTFPS